MIKKMNKMTKKLDIWDIALTKLTVLMGSFFLIGIWSGLREWVLSVDPLYFLAAFAIFAIRPMKNWFE